jgi:ubiquinone/menaquinone biosynthesis C-methylase UbiE
MPRSSKIAGVDRMLDRTAEAEDHHFWFKSLRRNAQLLLKRGLSGRAPALIVDCGAGTGRNLDWLSTFGPTVGFELSPTGLAHGRTHHRRLVRATVTALPIADATADVATSFDVLYCLDDADEVLAVREMFRVLRPGGVAIVNVAALDMLRGSHSVLTHERRRYTRRSLGRLLRSAGFQIETLTFANLSAFPPALAVRGWERISGRAGTASDADLRVPAAPINAAFNALATLEAAWLRLASLPIGTSVLALARKPPR